MEQAHKTLEFPVQVGQAEMVAYEVLDRAVGRKRAVAAFMAAKGISHAGIAKHIGCHFTRPYQLLNAESISPSRREQFESLGFPGFLLPPVSNRIKAA